MNKLIEQIDKLINKKGSLKTPAYYIRGLFIDIVNYFEKKINSLTNNINSAINTIELIKTQINNITNVNNLFNLYFSKDYSIFELCFSSAAEYASINIYAESSYLYVIFVNIEHNKLKIYRKSSNDSNLNIELYNYLCDGYKTYVVYRKYESVDFNHVISNIRVSGTSVKKLIAHQNIDFINVFNTSDYFFGVIEEIESLCYSNIIDSFNYSDNERIKISGNFNNINKSFNSQPIRYDYNIKKVNDVINSFKHITYGLIIDNIMVGTYNISSTIGNITTINEGIIKIAECRLPPGKYILPNSLKTLNNFTRSTNYTNDEDVEIFLHKGNRGLKIESKSYMSGNRLNHYITNDITILESFSVIDNNSIVDAVRTLEHDGYYLKDTKGNDINRINITKLSNNYLFYYNKGIINNFTGVLFYIDSSYFDIPQIYYRSYYFSDKLSNLYVPGGLMAVTIIIDSVNTINLLIGKAIEHPLNKIVVPVGATGYDEADLNSKNWTLKYVDSIEEYINDEYDN